MMYEHEMLNTTQSFDKLIEEANFIQSMCTDYKVPANSMRMNEALMIKFDDHELPLSNLATGHLCGKLNVPSRYFNRLVESGNAELAAENINYWLENPDDKRTFFIRSYAGMVRGVLSGSYSVYDAPEILQTIREVFPPENFILKGSYVSSERLHLRLIENTMLDIDGEDLYAGITLDSSDVGRSGLSVRFFIWKKVCTNGLVIAKSSGKLFRQKHIGINHEDFAAGLTEGLQNFYTLRDKIVESIKETNAIPVNDDYDELLAEIKDQTKLSDQAAEKVINLMQVKYAPTRWGMINGITEVAQEFTLETRIQLEEIAGNMLA